MQDLKRAFLEAPQTRFLPKKLNGVAVLELEGNSSWRASNDSLGAATPGIGYRATTTSFQIEVEQHSRL
jgi:hypothetical protein